MPEPAGRGAAEPTGKASGSDGRAGRIRKEPEILLGWRVGGLQREGSSGSGFILHSAE